MVILAHCSDPCTRRRWRLVTRRRNCAWTCGQADSHASRSRVVVWQVWAWGPGPPVPALDPSREDPEEERPPLSICLSVEEVGGRSRLSRWMWGIVACGFLPPFFPFARPLGRSCWVVGESWVCAQNRLRFRPVVFLIPHNADPHQPPKQAGQVQGWTAAPAGVGIGSIDRSRAGKVRSRGRVRLGRTCASRSQLKKKTTLRQAQADGPAWQ